MRVAAFTTGKTVPGSRFRVQQYIPFLQAHGIEMREFPARWGGYPPDSRALRPFWLLGTVLERIPSAIQSHGYDLTLLQRELVSTLATLEPFTRRPRVFDVDDAVWLNRGGRTGFATILKMCDGVICGNNFIADHARPWNDNICVLPTAVDTDRYLPSPEHQRRTPRRIIGWSGLSSGLKYVTEIEEALRSVLTRHPDVVLRIVSDKPPRFQHLSASQFEYIPWSPLNEVETIQEMSVGLMPVEDSLWARGKCSYKMLLYMSCGIPVVVSPVGMNDEILALGKIGFGPQTPSEWCDSVEWLLQNPEPGREMGRTGRKIVEEHYSVHVCVPKLASFLHAVLQNKTRLPRQQGTNGQMTARSGAASPAAGSRVHGVADERRFAFGHNWERFSQGIDESRIVQATRSLQSLLGTQSLEGRSFLDVGSGSGLFSLAALRLGAARVHSFDYDPDSVSCTERLKERFLPGSHTWTIARGDVLDEAYLKSLGTFDVLYSWGVLHHTGRMWEALDKVAGLVAPGGQMVVALYNDQGWRSRFWKSVKRVYNAGTPGRYLVRCVFIPGFVLGYLAKDILRGRNPSGRYRSSSSARGMSPLHDIEDWLGGHPFEVAKPEQVVAFYESRAFQCERSTTVGGKMGCNEFVFRRVPASAGPSSPARMSPPLHIPIG